MRCDRSHICCEIKCISTVDFLWPCGTLHDAARTFAVSFNTAAAPTVATAVALRVTVSMCAALGEGGECIKVELLSFCAGPLLDTLLGLSAGDAGNLKNTKGFIISYQNGRRNGHKEMQLRHSTVRL